MKTMSPGIDLIPDIYQSRSHRLLVHSSYLSISLTLQSFHSLVFSRESKALWEAALAPRLVPQGRRPLQPLTEGAWAWRRNPAQAAHQAWMVLLETPILLRTTYLLRVHPYLITTITHTPNLSHCLSLKPYSWDWEDLCLYPMCGWWTFVWGHLTPVLLPSLVMPGLMPSLRQKAVALKEFLAHQLKGRIYHFVLCVLLC